MLGPLGPIFGSDPEDYGRPRESVMNAAVRGKIILTSVNSPGCVLTSIPRVLLHNDVVSDGQTKAGALSSRFCCEERIEHLVPDLGRNAGAVVTNADLNFVTEVLCHRR